MSLFDISERAQQLQAELLDFDERMCTRPSRIYERQMRESGDPHFQPPIIEELKAEARHRGLWNLFHPHPDWGPGLTNLEYAPLAEIMGRSHIPPRRATDRPGHRQHGGADTVRHRRAQGALAQAAAGRGDPVGVRHDRARGGQLGRHQHRD